jgi:hypothetical protein
MKLTPDLAGTIDLAVFIPHSLDLHHKGGVTPASPWKSRGIGLTSLVLVVRRRGEAALSRSARPRMRPCDHR